MFFLTPVVRDLIIINVLFFVGTSFMGEVPIDVLEEVLNSNNENNFSELQRYMLASYYPSSPFFKHWQLVTHMFMHADFGHLFFNMLGLFFFGPQVETTLGHKRFLSMYLICGLGAWVLFNLVRWYEFNYTGLPLVEANTPMLGASGAIFGVLAAFGYLFPKRQIFMLFPPVALPAGLYVALYAIAELIYGIGPFSTGIAHFAHLGGMVGAIILLLAWKQHRPMY